MAGADLTREDREALTEFLSKPLSFPAEFKNWLQGYLAQNIPQIPVSQLLGYKGTLANISIVNDFMEMSGGDRTWQEPGDGLPVEITGLADGTYFVCWGYLNYGGNLGSAHGRVGVSVNGADPTYYCESTSIDQGCSNWYAQVMSVKNGSDNNDLHLMYWFDNNGGAVAQFEKRWLVALRVT